MPTLGAPAMICLTSGRIAASHNPFALRRAISPGGVGGDAAGKNPRPFRDSTKVRKSRRICGQINASTNFPKGASLKAALIRLSVVSISSLSVLSVRCQFDILCI
jgi:hypothetical protein